jgi:glycosyltransferase involved in cell wall biosynthesis
MKVAVYTIALNEEQFVEAWVESAKDADYLLIADTGSTDNTVALAETLGVNVISIGIRPWRFDDARNASLAAIPLDIDYCIALDMDEVLLPGWRAELEKAYAEGWTRPRYQYTWSWQADGKPGLQYGGDKVHARQGYRWKHPVHEVLTSDRLAETQGWVGLEIHHHPDNTKSRGQYMPLLELSAREDPYDDRNAFYYARELFFYKRYQEAAVEFQRHLKLPKAVWPPERAASMRYLAKCLPDQALSWLQEAIAESPGRREALVELAQYFYNGRDWENCYRYAIEALAVEDKPLDYLCEEFAWNELPYDLAAIAAWNLGMYTEAFEYGSEAVKINPNDPRLATNLIHYSAAFSS